MKRIVVLIMLAALAWKGYEKYSLSAKDAGTAKLLTSEREITAVEAPISSARLDSSSPFACDGRTYCSQMKSCEEAKYFLQHCPDVKMDGNNDGIPCEKQWCK